MPATYTNKEILIGTVLDLCPFGTVISNDTVGTDFKPTAESTDWQSGGEVIDYKITPQTEDDARTVFSRASKTYVTRKNTKVTGNTIEINVADVNPYFWQIIYQTQEKLTANEEVQPFARNKFGLDMWVRLTKYNEDKTQIMLLEVAGTVKVEIPTENNKLVTPKVTVEVLDSDLNSLTPSAEIAFPATTTSA